MEIKDLDVARLMSSDLVTVTPDTGIETAGSTLLEESIGSVLVLDEDGELAGILTAPDFGDVVSSGGAADAPAGGYMTGSVRPLRVRGSPPDAAPQAVTHNIPHPPVTHQCRARFLPPGPGPPPPPPAHDA